MTDMLAPQSATWTRGFTLAARDPAIRAEVANIYRDFALTAKSDAERSYCLDQAEKWSQP